MQQNDRRLLHCKIQHKKSLITIAKRQLAFVIQEYRKQQEEFSKVETALIKKQFFVEWK